MASDQTVLLLFLKKSAFGIVNENENEQQKKVLLSQISDKVDFFI